MSRPPIRTTHTYAELEVSERTYDEVRAKLTAAGYTHAFMDDGTIDMHGIGLTITVEPEAKGMNRDLSAAPPHTDVLVAWLDADRKQVSFVARLLNDGFWYANGSRIATPSAWTHLPEIGQ